MRTTKNLTVSLPPAQLREMEKTAKKENRTMSELVRETFRRYQRDEEDRRLAADPVRAQRLLELKETVTELRKEAVKTGLAKLSDRQITAEVEAYRQQKRKTKTKQPVR
jgi:Arc/MetJ-type ribon-helix-helix transcriptional regulator